MGKRGADGGALLAINVHFVENWQRLRLGTALDKRIAWHAIAWRLSDARIWLMALQRVNFQFGQTNRGRPSCIIRRA